jgi:membrane-associated progesterone receptor component
MSLSNPLNAALVPAILFVAYRILFPSKPTAPATPATRYDQGEYNWAPTKHPKTAVYKDYDVHELSLSDGRGNPRILLAIARIVDGEISERTVFDVSAGANFYGPEGMYGNFAGRDASRGMAKQSFDEGGSGGDGVEARHAHGSRQAARQPQGPDGRRDVRLS